MLQLSTGRCCCVFESVVRDVYESEVWTGNGAGVLLELWFGSELNCNLELQVGP
jgi:hypothetical protein